MLENKTLQCSWCPGILTDNTPALFSGQIPLHPKVREVQPKAAKTFNSKIATVSDTNLFICLQQTNRKN